ncbi:MAG: class I SAM-dependent methyltransferase [Actinomycetota bacterium]|nr:class I SAM-dependent methyltransferase [Actinomycetota bacterium]
MPRSWLGDILHGAPRLRLRRVAHEPELPIPPLGMRELVGPTDPVAFDNPDGTPVYPDLDPAVYESVFDFGCGCGRVARQLIQQRPRPKRYVGVDLHRGMIEWCRRNLAPHAPGFEFHHHDVFNVHFNPDRSKPDVLAFPAADASFTLVNAFSVFTHLTEPQAEHYLDEIARILCPDGVLHSTWFLMDKREFPMLQERANALYASPVDPSAAVIFDRGWLRARAREAGLTIVSVTAPRIRGYQWVIVMTPTRPGLAEAELPPDRGDIASVDLPDMPPDASKIGLESE